MKFKALHPNFKLPTRGTDQAGAYDLYMPEAGIVMAQTSYASFVPLGFSAEVPGGHVALLLPRSSVGAKQGLALNNTCGVIDADYRGEWVAAIRVHNSLAIRWNAGDRLLQMLIVPVAVITPVLADELTETVRGQGGFGSTGS